MIKCSKEVILITWSKVGQAGHFHVNNKNKEEVIELFKKKGLKYNSNITYKLKNIFELLLWAKYNNKFTYLIYINLYVLTKL